MKTQNNEAYRHVKVLQVSVFKNLLNKEQAGLKLFIWKQNSEVIWQKNGLNLFSIFLYFV